MRLFRWETLLILVIALLIVYGIKAWRPRDRELPVAFTDGDVYSKLSRGVWNPGETQLCELASATDERGDLFLCGLSVRNAWQQTWIRKDIKDRIYQFAERRQVYFRGSGDSAGRHRVVYRCTLESEALTCK